MSNELNWNYFFDERNESTSGLVMNMVRLMCIFPLLCFDCESYYAAPDT